MDDRISMQYNIIGLFQLSYISIIILDRTFKKKIKFKWMSEENMLIRDIPIITYRPIYSNYIMNQN